MLKVFSNSQRFKSNLEREKQILLCFRLKNRVCELSDLRVWTYEFDSVNFILFFGTILVVTFQPFLEIK